MRFALERSIEAVHPGLRVVQHQVAIGNRGPDQLSRVLFLCTHNSARSQIAEAILRHQGVGLAEVASAGSDPTEVHPLVFQALTELRVDGRGLRSKHWSVFADQRFDYVITLCDIVREVCPVFPGEPEHLHWSLPDPVAGAKSPRAADAAFRQTAEELMTRTRYLLPVLTKHSQA